MRSIWLASLCALMTSIAACGSSQEPAQPSAAAAPEASSGDEQTQPDAKGGMAVEGTLGTIPERRIEEVMQAKLPAFQRCFFDGMSEVEFLAGHIKFYFRVALDGSVEYVHPRGSSIGHRATEQCLLGIAKKARFPKPQGGGAAEFVWGFELDAPGGVRPPVEWKADRVIQSVLEQRGSLASCNLDGARYVITVYIAPGGNITAAGAAAESQEAADKIDCLVDIVRTWHMPDPGSYSAKVSFDF